MQALFIAAALIAATFGLWRYNASDMTPTPATAHAAATGEMTTQQLLDLNKTDPAAFNAYVMAHINDTPPAAGKPEEKAVQKTMSMDEFIKAGKTDPQAVAAFLESHTEQPERTELDKFFNLLAHGKYE